MDPHEESYANVSPYSFLNNNPMKNIDPDGRDVIIYYKDDNNKKQQFVLSNKTDLKNLPSNTFVKQVVLAYQHMLKTDGGKSFQKVVNDTEIKVGLLQSDKKDFYSDGTISWNPLGGLETNNGTVLSPANGLYHEADHSYDDMKNHATHEKRVSEKDE